MTIRIEGLEQAQRAFDERLKKVEAYTARALVDVVLMLTGEAVKRAPVDIGDLRGSGRGEVNGRIVAEGKKDGGIKVQRPNFKSQNLQGTVSFSTPYALRQHEELSYNHPQGGQAKYLEEPFVRNTAKYIKHLADSVERAVD